jgi:hypothetical protein
MPSVEKRRQSLYERRRWKCYAIDVLTFMMIFIPL